MCDSVVAPRVGCVRLLQPFRSALAEWFLQQKLSGLELTAVATSNQNSADAAAKECGAARGYGNATDLLRDPNVDVVTIGVKVPDHRALVLEALPQGKHLYCEWPLGRDVSESEELRNAAHAAGVHAVIGVQTRMSPAVHHARELIASIPTLYNHP